MNSVKYITEHPYRIVVFILVMLIFAYYLFSVAQNHFWDEPIDAFPHPIIADPVEQTIDPTPTIEK